MSDTVFVEPVQNSVFIEKTEQLVLVETTEVGVALVEGRQGPSGPAGSSSFQMVAGATLGGHRIVRADSSGNAIYADNTTLADANAVIGMTLGAASLNASVSVQSAGEVSDPSFSYTPGDILYLATNGQVTTTAPTTGFLLVLGYAETATKVFLNIGEPIILS